MSDPYMTMNSELNRVYIKCDVMKSIDTIDGLILDCDGVLIDNYKLYSEAVKRTLAFFFESFNVDGGAIDNVYSEFKARGLFNNDWIITFCIILGIICCDKDLLKVYISINPDLDIRDKISEIMKQSSLKKVVSKLPTLFLSRISSPSIRSLSKALETEEHVIKRLMTLLLLPMDIGKGLIPTLFEEIYHGPLITKIYNVESIIGEPEGLIGKEEISIDENRFNEIFLKFKGKIGLMTGRPRKSAEYSLSSVLNYISYALYLEDGGGDKPSISPLKRVMYNLEINNPLVVGDSAEEIIMVKNARKAGLKCFSCGVTGGMGWKMRLFKSLEADVICDSTVSLFNFLGDGYGTDR